MAEKITYNDVYEYIWSLYFLGIITVIGRVEACNIIAQHKDCRLWSETYTWNTEYKCQEQ